MNKADIVDVTDKWEPKTRGGHVVIRVESFSSRNDIHLIFLYGASVVGSQWLNLDGRVSANTESIFDLVPRKPAPTPMERVLPFVDHWWRTPGQKTIGLLTGFRKDEVAINGYGWVVVSLVAEIYQHAAAIPGTKPEDWKWESVP